MSIRTFMWALNPISVLLAALSGCTTFHDSPFNLVVHYEGFETFNYPRTGDGPGTIICIDNQGKRIAHNRVLVKDKYVEQTYEAIPKRRVKKTLSGFLKFLRLEGIGAGADYSVKQEFVIELAGVSRERIYRQHLYEHLKEQSIAYDSGWKCHVIVETIAANKIKYQYVKSGDFDANAQLVFNEALQASGRFKSENGAQESLIEAFDQPHRIFYKETEFLPPGKGLHASGDFVIIEMKGYQSTTWED